MKDKIAKLLLEIHAVDIDTKVGFVYTSERKGPIYCDNRLILSYPKQRNEVVESFLQLIREKKLEFDFVAGVATGAIAWATIIAERLKKPMVYVRTKKEHGKENEIEGELEDGKKVLVIEDLINTGGSSVEACKAVKDANCHITACLAIFNYGFEEAAMKFSREKIALYSLSNFNTMLTVALNTKFINNEEKKLLLEWHKNPKEWKP